MENVKLINKYLISNYGMSLDNKPKFRVAWSEDLFETRKGLFGPLAVTEEIRQVPKYMFFSDRYVLEVYVLAFPEVYGRAILHKKDVVMHSDNYEPLRVFQTKKGVYLRPDIEVCKIICDGFCDLINRPEGRRLTEKIATYDDVRKMREEVAKFESILNMDDSDMLQKLRYNEAVVLPGKEFS